MRVPKKICLARKVFLCYNGNEKIVYKRVIILEWKLNNEKFTYILRYYLPALPQYGEEVTKSRLCELIDFCKECDVKAVMFYVDLNPYWYYMPDTEEHNSYLVGVISEAAEKLRENGISYQLNYQNLFGSWDGNFDHRDMLTWECYVDEFGRESKGVGCMTGEKFRKIAGGKLAVWAQTKPDVIWIDDDIRQHNHRTGIEDFWSGKTSAEGLDFGCFCDRDIAEFNKRNGLSLSREEIQKECLENGSEIRKKWFNFINSVVCDMSDFIEKTVHKYSPDTRVALMTSCPDVHAVEGRNWGEMLKALSKPHAPLLRAHFGPYAEGNPRDFANAHLLLQQLKANIEHQYKERVDYAPEIENTRFGKYQKSIAATSYQIYLSAFEGCRGVTLSICDLEGCRFEEEGELFGLLKSCKKYADAALPEKLWEYKPHGAAFITSPERIADAKFSKKPSRFSGMVADRNLDRHILLAGVPCTYAVPRDSTDVKTVVLSRDTAKLLTDDEIKAILAHGVFADAEAAAELCERGFSEYLGISVGEKMMCIAGSELLHTIKHNDSSDIYIPSRIEGGKWRKITLCGAEALSSLVTPGGEYLPGFTFYRNSLGGAVSVYAGGDGLGDGFMTKYRTRLIRDIFDMLGAELVRADFDSYGILNVRENEKGYAVMLANLSADTVEKIDLAFPENIKNVRILKESGETVSAESCGNAAEINVPMPLYGTVTVFAEKDV